MLTVMWNALAWEATIINVLAAFGGVWFWLATSATQ